jgi:hypothetical protein
MGFKDIIAKIGEKQRERKELLRSMQDKIRMQKIAEDRMKSSNERELDDYMNEEREKEIKKALEIMRKNRNDDINFNHNPLNAKNIMKAEWELLKEKNQFAKKSNMFSKKEFIHKNNPNILKNNKNLMNNGRVLKN